MIRSTFAGFNTAILGLSASQRAIDVTGQNLSNINTQGYTRQRLDQISLNPVGPSLANSQFSAKVGKGVMMTGVSQIRDPFLDVQYRNQLPKVGTADAMDSILAQIGQIFDETDKDAVAVQFNDIISQLQSLSEAGNAGTQSSDTVVRSACEVLLNTIRQNGIEIQGVYDELLTKLDTIVVPDINGYLQDIVEKNVAIKNTQVLGNPGLELMDARNEMIDALATYFPIEVNYEKQNLGGGIVVDILNIDLKMSDGSKVRLVADNMCGEVGIAKYQDGDQEGKVVEPVEMYFKTASENPKTYGGGAEVLKKELPNEVQGYLDDIAELNKSIQDTQDKIAVLQGAINTTTANVAKTHEDRINGYIGSINTLNTTVAEKTAEMANLNGQITALNTQINDLRTALRNTTDATERERLRTQIDLAQNDIDKLSSDLKKSQGERNVAESQRIQTLNKLREYFPADTVDASLDENRLMTVDVTTTDAAGNTGKSVLVSPGAANTGSVGVNVVGDEVTYSVTGIANSQNGTAQSSNVISKAIDSAVSDMQSQIQELQARLPGYEKKRAGKITELQSYFPDQTLTTTTNADNIMNVYLSAPGAAAPGANDPVLVSGSNAGTVSFGAGTDANGNPQVDITGVGAGAATAVNVASSVIDRMMNSVNDQLADGVLKGDLDMLNKAEVFDAYIDPPTKDGNASDTKGIQYYQKMLDTFIDEFASTMNILNMTEDVPTVDENGNAVIEKVVKPGNILFESTEDTPEMAALYKDKDGNWTTKETSVDDQGNIVQNDPVYEPQVDAEGNVMLDENGRIIYKEDANGNKVQVEIPVNFTAQSIKVSDAWMKGDAQINTKRTPLEGGNSSDNWNVNRMIEALSTDVHSFINPNGDGEVFKGTLYECYTSIQGTQSTERKATSLILDTRTTVLDQIADDKDSVSGVWMDEEVMSLMKYSQSYNAASRLMTVMDEVLDRLITQTGACGR